MPEVCRLVAKYARMTRAEAQTAIADPKTPMVELAIASIFAQCAKNGDYTRLAFLLDRSIGKPKEPEEIQDMENDLDAMSTEDLIKLVKETLPDLDKGA